MTEGRGNPAHRDTTEGIPIAALTSLKGAAERRSRLRGFKNEACVARRASRKLPGGPWRPSGGAREDDEGCQR